MLTISTRIVPSHKIISHQINLQKNRPNRLQYKRSFQSKRSLRCNASFDNFNDLIVHNSYLVGKYIGYIVLFSATLNWMSYRRIRRIIEDDHNSKSKPKK
jgi:hypothetical protein